MIDHTTLSPRTRDKGKTLSVTRPVEQPRVGDSTAIILNITLIIISEKQTSSGATSGAQRQARHFVVVKLHNKPGKTHSTRYNKSSRIMPITPCF
jgi:hypothetical protein